MTENVQAQIETLSDLGETAQGTAAYWKQEIRGCDKELERWRKRGMKVVRRYRAEASDAGRSADDEPRRYNVLWSNIRTTLPAVYGKPPQPTCERRYKDPDATARVGSMILERVVQFQIDHQHSFHEAVKGAVEDRLLPGMGTVWVRYEEPEAPAGSVEGVDDDSNEPTTEDDGKEGPDEETAEDAPVTDKVSANTDCVAAVDYVYWQDFGFVPAHTWDEVPAVWRIVHMNRKALVARFGKEIGGEVALDYVPARHKEGESDEPKQTTFAQAKVYEIWDKRTRMVTWISMAHPIALDTKPDPYHFPNFFPCPKPLFATTTTGNLLPVPDYVEYQDQALELDEITERLHYLVKALKVVGVYDQESTEVQRMLTDGVENTLIPVDRWAAFAEKGGIKGAVDFMPIQNVIEVVTQLQAVRQQLIQDIYQITGLSDIVRGSTNPNETAKAQSIKAQFASVRLEDMKADVSRFASDILRLMAHIVCELFPDEAIVEQSAIMQSIDGQEALKKAQQAIAKAMLPPPPAGPAPGGGQPGAQPPGPPMGMGGGQPGMPPPAPPPPSMQMQSQAFPPGNGGMGQMGGMPMGGNGMGGAPIMPPLAGMGAPSTMDDMVPPGSVVEQAIQLLRDKSASFRIEVAAQSLITPDLDGERKSRNEFLTAVTQFLQQAIPAASEHPALAPVLNALLLWGVRGFSVGRDIEGMIESSLSNLAANPPQPKQDPKLEAMKMKAQLDQANQQAASARANQQAMNEVQLAREKMSMEREQMMVELQNERAKTAAEIDAMLKKAQAEIEAILIKANVEAGIARDKAAQDAQVQATAVQADVNARAVENAQALAHQDQVHAQEQEQGQGQGQGQVEAA